MESNEKESIVVLPSLEYTETNRTKEAETNKQN